MSAECPGSACVVCPHAHKNMLACIQALPPFTGLLLCIYFSAKELALNMLLGAGVLPSEWARMQNISELSLSYNNISGILGLYQLDAQSGPCVVCLHVM